MKKIIAVIFSVLIISSFFSVYAQDIKDDNTIVSNTKSKKEFIGKLGTAYAEKAKKFGLDFSLNYFYRIDPYFAAGVELDFYWVNWKQNTAKKYLSHTIVDIFAATNAYNIPLYFNAQVRFPKLLQKIRVEPSLTAGLGYSCMVLDFTRRAYIEPITNRIYSKKKKIIFYRGFTWQTLFSIAFRPAEESNIAFILDTGYRGIYTGSDNDHFPMSGLLVRLGVRLYL